MKNLTDLLDLLCAVLAGIVVILSILWMQFDGHVYYLGLAVGLGVLSFVIRDYTGRKPIDRMFEED